MRTQHILLILAALFLSSCGNVSKQSPCHPLDQTLYQPEYATGFDIRSNGMQSSLITVHNPWQGADSVTTQLFIARNNENAPDGFAGQIINGDARRIVTMSSTHIAMLNAVNADSLVVGVSGIDYITNPTIQKNRAHIGDVGSDGNINYELLLTLNPDIVLLYGVNGSSSMESKLTELCIPYMYVGDYLEESPLGKAEWLIAIAEITGNRDNGIRRFSEIAAAYDALKSKVAESAPDAPSVMLNTPYGDSWFMPSTESYMARLISDAGGNYIYKKNTGNASTPVNLEEAYQLTAASDMWLNTGAANSLDDLKATCPKFTDTRCVRNGYVYNNTRRATASGGNDFYESAVVHPDILLRDLIKIFHPEMIDEDFVYYKQLK